MRFFNEKKADVFGLNYPDQIDELHELYKQALIDEFNSNSRSEEFIQELIEVLATFLFLITQL